MLFLCLLCCILRHNAHQRVGHISDSIKIVQSKDAMYTLIMYDRKDDMKEETQTWQGNTDMAKGTKYDQQFKENAVRYRLDHPELTLKKAAENMGISDSALKTWIRAAKEHEGCVPSITYS